MDEAAVIPYIRSRVQERAASLAEIGDDQVRQWIEDEVFLYAREHYLNLEDKRSLIERIFHAMRGYDVLQPLLDDETITEVMVNRFDEIFIERHGKIEKSRCGLHVLKISTTAYSSSLRR